MSTWFVTGASRGLAPIARGVERAVEEFDGIDILVNNAGRSLLGAVEEVTDAEARTLFDLNVFGLVNMTRAVLPYMRRAGRGTLVHVGSRSGYEGEPGVGLYCASKFALTGIGEALASELEPFGIRSIVVEPGVLRTDFLDRSSLALAEHRLSDYDGPPRTTPWSGRTRPTTLSSASRSAARSSSRRPRCQTPHPGDCRSGRTPSSGSSSPSTGWARSWSRGNLACVGRHSRPCDLREDCDDDRAGEVPAVEPGTIDSGGRRPGAGGRHPPPGGRVASGRRSRAWPG